MVQNTDATDFDYVRDLRGDNEIDVGDGGSAIFTGNGDDTITAGDGYDYVNAGKGDNEISVGDGGSFIITGHGDDIIISGDGYDVVLAGKGDNAIDVGDGGSHIKTGSGDDTIIAGDGWDFVNAGHGENLIDIGAGGGVVITGREDDDVTLKSSGYSFAHTGSGNDTVTYIVEDSLHFSRLFGGHGHDTLVLDLPLDIYKDEHFQNELAYFLEFKAPDGRPFYFCSLNLYVHSFEAIEIVVDGVSFDPLDLDVTATGDTATVREDDGAVLQGSVLANDATPNGFASVSLVAGPEKGALVLNDDGTYSFDPDGAFEDLAEGETTEVTFTYEVSDIDGDTAQAEVTITVIGDNDAPFLAEGSLEAAEDGETVSLDLSALGGDVDSDDDGASLTYVITGEPADGMAEIDGATLSFTPGAGFQDLAEGETREVTVTVTATDRHGAEVSADYTIIVTGTNDGPVAQADDNAGDAVVEEGSSEAGDATAEGNVLSNDSDVDTSDTLVVQSVASGAATGTGGVGQSVTGTYGAVVIASDGSYTYTLDNTLAATDGLAPGEVVTDVFTYEVSDGNGGTASATLTISITGSEDNRPPVAQGDSLTIGEADLVGPSGAATVAFNVLDDNGSGADSDPDGDAIIVQSAGGAAAGTSFGVTTTSSIAALSGLVLTASVAANGDVTLDTQDGSGAFLFDGLGGDETASVSFDYTIQDPSGETSTATATITIRGTEDAPEISGVTTADVAEDGTLSASGQLLATDADLGDSPEFTVETIQGTYGSFSIGAGGEWTYTLDNDAAQALSDAETVDEVFTLTATTADGESVQTSFTVTVTGQEDAPVITGTDTGAVIEDTDPSASGTLAATDADAGDTPAFVAQSDTAGTYGTFSIDTDGNWSYDLGSEAQALQAGQTETETFSVTVQTADGETETTTVEITVTGTNDAPVAGDLSADATEPFLVQFDASVDDTNTPNLGRWYVLDLDTGIGTTVLRNTSNLLTSDQVAEIYLSQGNGIIATSNGNNLGFGINAATFTGGVRTDVPREAWEVEGSTGGVGTVDPSDPGAFPEVLYFFEGTDTVDLVSLSLTGVERSDGTLMDVTLEMTDLDYEFFTGDDVQIGNVSISAQGTAPQTVTVTADVSDPDLGDTQTISVDTTGTLGGVIDNGDGTFTYEVTDAFEFLAEGETATDTFTYTVEDEAGATDTATVEITVTGTNDAAERSRASLADEFTNVQDVELPFNDDFL